MYYDKIPPHMLSGDRVTISPEVKKRLQQNIDNELEYRKGSGKIVVDFDNETHSQVGNSITKKDKRLSDLIFIGIISFLTVLCFGTILAAVISH